MTGRVRSRVILWGAASLIMLLSIAGCMTRAQQRYHRAEAFLAQGKYQLAAVDYHRIAQDSPDAPLADDALYKLAYLHREELDNPAAALQTYRYLVDTYPRSNYTDDALLWMIHIARRYLHDPEMVAALRGETDKRFPKDLRLCAQAWLQSAGAYHEAGQVEEARRQCRTIVERFAKQRTVAAEASLLLANMARDESVASEQILKLYEQVIKQYPDTLAAAKARQAAGWLYYNVKTKEDEEVLAQQQRLAHVLQDVPPIESQPGRPAGELLAAMRALLGQAGVDTSLDELMVISGLAFTFCFDPDRPEALQRFSRNPLPLVADEMGFGYNLWTSADLKNALAAVTTNLRNSRPLLIAYGTAQARPALITGYKPAEKKVYLNLAGRKAIAVDEDTFAGQWQPAQTPGLWAPKLEAGYQFSLTTRREQPAPENVVKLAVLRADLAMDQAELLGAPAGQAGYEAFIQFVRECLPAEARASRSRLAQWAHVGLPMLVSARQAAARHLGLTPPEVPARERGALSAASQSYQQLAARWQQLGEVVEQANVEPASSGPDEEAQLTRLRTRLLREAEVIALQEQRTLQDLATALGG